MQGQGIARDEAGQSAVEAMLARARKIAGDFEGALIKEQDKNIELPDLVRPGELMCLLDHVEGHAEVLSLDCFSTLLWRRTSTVSGVFLVAQNSPEFREFGLTATLREEAELGARSLAFVRRGTREVGLAEIYSFAFPELREADISKLCLAELAAVNHCCNVFSPIGDAIHAAQSKGMKVAVVSDSPLNEGQLRWLLGQQLAPDDYDAIDMVLCSCDVKLSKKDGLYGELSRQLGVKRERIVHLGENVQLDRDAARMQGVAGIHWETQSVVADDVLRLNESAGRMILPELGSERPFTSPYRGIFMEKEHQEGGAYLLGYLGLGPVYFSFAKLLQGEVRRLRAAGERPKVAFWGAQSYLARCSFEALGDGEACSTVELSLYAVRAASFVDWETIERYLVEEFSNASLKELCKQFLLREDEVQRVVDSCAGREASVRSLVLELKQGGLITSIVERSKAYRERLWRHLEKQCALGEGDTLVIVGIEGESAVQELLATKILSERGVGLFGCYLFALPRPRWQSDRVGVLDASWCESRVMDTLIPFLGTLKTLSSSGRGEVRAYEDSGEPLCEEKEIPPELIACIQPILSHCVRFVVQTEESFSKARKGPPLGELREACLAGLTRLIYFPQAKEVELLESLRMNASLDGSEKTESRFPYFDSQRGLDALRRRGVLFSTRQRMGVSSSYPTELRAAGVEASVLLLAQSRYGVKLTPADFSQRGEPIGVLALRGEEATGTELYAKATHDGCFSLEISVGACDFNVGLLFGRAFKYIQLYSVDLIEASQLYAPGEDQTVCEVLHEIQCEGATDCGEGLLSFGDRDGFIFLSPGAHRQGNKSFIYRVVFRPLVRRQEGADILNLNP